MPSQSHGVPRRQPDGVSCQPCGCMCSRGIVTHARTWLRAAHHGACRRRLSTRQAKKVNASISNPKVFSSNSVAPPAPALATISAQRRASTNFTDISLTKVRWDPAHHDKTVKLVDQHLYEAQSCPLCEVTCMQCCIFGSTLGSPGMTLKIPRKFISQLPAGW